MMRTLRPALLALLLAGCTSSTSQPQVQEITLATTTSARDTGLLDVLLPRFEQEHGIRVNAVAVGSGQALEIGRRGDADVLLTHSPAQEEQFVQDGFAGARRRIMRNDFVLLGPAGDPAGVRSTEGIVAALQAVAKAQSPFVSRGDESGTHVKEKGLWEKAGIAPEGDWYLKAGDGMAATLRMASEKQAYTISDRATFAAQQAKLGLKIVCENDPPLDNVYSILVVSGQKHPHVKEAAAEKFADFLASPEIQQAIGEFGKDKYGEALFFPARP
jgi:tungstate transport system substrate-binding protein